MRFLTLITLAVLMTSNSPVSRAKEPTSIPEIEMVEVKGGTFVMGLDESEAEHSYETPRHQVTLSDFRIGKYEVTQDLWKAVMGDNPSHHKGDSLPVESVSWKDIQVFIKKLNKMTGRNYRLPTEAEWEYAARGANKTAGYAFIGGDNPDTTAWSSYNSWRQPHTVGTKKPNELGIYDMGGNVSEWVQDWYEHYSEKHQRNPQGAKKSDIGKIFRGGSWNVIPDYNNPGCRFVSNPNFKCNSIGFRLAE